MKKKPVVRARPLREGAGSSPGRRASEQRQKAEIQRIGGVSISLYLISLIFILGLSLSGLRCGDFFFRDSFRPVS